MSGGGVTCSAGSCEAGPWKTAGELEVRDANSVRAGKIRVCTILFQMFEKPEYLCRLSLNNIYFIITYPSCILFRNP